MVDDYGIGRACARRWTSTYEHAPPLPLSHINPARRIAVNHRRSFLFRVNPTGLRSRRWRVRAGRSYASIPAVQRGDLRARVVRARRWRRKTALRVAGVTRAETRLESRLVWLFGSPRSGTTWLLRLLAEHEAVVTINEPLIGYYLGPFLSDQPGFDASKLDSSNFTLRRVGSRSRQSFFAEEFSDVWLPQLGRLLRKRFLAHVASYSRDLPLSRTTVLIKEPNGSQSADIIMRALPRAHLLFLLRDGRDVVDSELASNLQGSWVGDVFPGATGISDEGRLEFVIQSAYKWLWRTEVVQEAYSVHPGPKRLIRYEDLRRDPLTNLRPIFRDLGLGIEESELSALVERTSFERLPVEDRGPGHFARSASVGTWRENLTMEEQRNVRRILGPKLHELGYDTSPAPADGSAHAREPAARVAATRTQNRSHQEQ